MTRKEYLEKLEEVQSVYPHLEIVESNDSISDYPSGIREALIGFKDIDEVEQVAEKYFSRLDILEFDRKDGHHFYTRRGCNWDGIDVDSKIGDDYELFTGNGKQYFEEQKDILRDMLEYEESVEVFQVALEQIKEICDAADYKDDDEQLIIREGKLQDTIKKNPTEFSYDTHNYVIGICELN
jgi:hypothetical protein